MNELPHTALTRWGDWFRVMRVARSDYLTFHYHKEELPGGDANYYDLIAELVDQSIAAMPDTMAQISQCLMMKYGFRLTAYEAREKARVSEKQYHVLINQGVIWVYSHLTALKNRFDCPIELKDFFRSIEETVRINQRRAQQEALPNGPMQRRTN